MPITRHINKRRAAAQRRAVDANRGTARERGYSTAWDRFSRSWLASNPLCAYCAAQGITAAAELVDHIEPHRGDPDLFWPPAGVRPEVFFASCCRACHNGPKQAAERAAQRQGVPVREVLQRRGMLA